MATPTTPEAQYDFIVVGGGNAGAVIAARLAATPTAPSVLLLEAGGSNEGLEHMSGAERYNVAFQPGSAVNWGYKTSPQHGGRVVDYSRGKGLGGSTAINFCGWLVGPRDDFDEWARRVGDEDFGWENVRKCMRRVERLRDDVPEGFRGHIAPKEGDHGVAGRVDLSYQTGWHESVQTVFEAGKQCGYGSNPDVNSGDPIGLGIGPNCIYNGVRVTAASAYLHDPPLNLTIYTESHVAKVILQDKVAIGVETTDGTKYRARREVIVSAGALNTPQILMLSGIGPSSELQQHGIAIQHHLPSVGHNLQDHCFCTAGIVIGEQGNKPESKQGPSPMGWFKNDAVMDSPEFVSLPQDMQTYLQRPTVPMWELVTHTPFLDAMEDLAAHEDVLSAIALLMIPQSTGTVTLNSANPLDPPLIDPKFLSHPFDQRAAIEALRALLQFLQAPALREKTLRLIGWPEAPTTDEGLLAHFQTTLRSSWHMCGTVRMGCDAAESCVDAEFRVHGLQRLRVVDMSVVSLIPNTHTQTTAYILAEIAADKLIAHHGLERKIERL